MSSRKVREGRSTTSLNGSCSGHSSVRRSKDMNETPKSLSITFLLYGTWDCLSGETHKVREPRQCSERGKAAYRGKVGRSVKSYLAENTTKKYGDCSKWIGTVSTN